MALATVAIPFDISDKVGVDFDARRTKAWVTTSAETIIDTVGNTIRTGSGTAAVAADGTGTFNVWVPGTGSNPASWQTTFHFSVPDRNAPGGRLLLSYGPFTITVAANMADLVAEMPVQPEYAAEVFDRLDALEADSGVGDALAEVAAQVSGYTNHGNVSGSVTFNGPTASHRFTATGPTTVTLSGYDEGQVATLICFGGADDVLVTNAGDVTLVDNTAWSAELAMGAWISGGGGGTPATPDTTPPSAVTGLVATGGSGQVSATWTAATDAESTVSYQWRVWLTSGGATGAWTTTTSTSFVKTGITTAGGYTVEVYAYSTGGASATATATATVTVNPYPTAEAYDTFTRTGSLWGSTTEGGALTWGSTGVSGLIGGSGNPVITSGKSGDGAATVDIGRTTATVECDYILNTGRASLMLGGANDGSTSVMARVFSAGELKVFHPAGGGTQIGSTVTGIALTGHFTLSYNAGTGAIEVKIDGVTKFTGTHTGLTGTRSGIECNNDATIDNIVWNW